jgi:hypothetical protein
LAYALERVANRDAGCLVVAELRRLSGSVAELGRVLEQVYRNGGRLEKRDQPIDTNAFPPKVLLIRGSVELETVDGVPEGYLETGRKSMTEEQYLEWEAGVKGLYDQMVVIRVTPTWVKLLDFETTIPQAVEELVRAKATGD